MEEHPLDHLLPLLEEIQAAKQQVQQLEHDLESHADVYHAHIKKVNEAKSQMRYLTTVLDMCLTQNMDPTQAKLTMPPATDQEDEFVEARPYMGIMNSPAPKPESVSKKIYQKIKFKNLFK